ncbi:MAG: ATP synthase subunit I [Candidatus Cloacimonetes bacterium]|nr:ATP synthase subunit I [Candidatus Cloacimonadota bacterium]
MDNRQYVLTILKLILLTNLPALIFLSISFKSSIGWMLGSIASAVNFWLMARNTLNLIPEAGKANVVRTAKGFVFRYLYLIVWSVLVLYFIKPELISYCLGLLSAQIVVFLYQFYHNLRYGKLEKYFRGEDE